MTAKERNTEQRFPRQVWFIDSEEKKHLGILLESGDVICCCCGGIQEASERGQTWQIIEECGEWKGMTQSEKTIRVFLWDGLIDEVQSSEEGDSVCVEVYNCDSDYYDREKYEKQINDPAMHCIPFYSAARELLYEDEEC